jgi:hypothetical protein
MKAVFALPAIVMVFPMCVVMGPLLPVFHVKTKTPSLSLFTSLPLGHCIGTDSASNWHVHVHVCKAATGGFADSSVSHLSNVFGRWDGLTVASGKPSADEDAKWDTGVDSCGGDCVVSGYQKLGGVLYFFDRVRFTLQHCNYQLLLAL